MEDEIKKTILHNNIRLGRRKRSGLFWYIELKIEKHREYTHLKDKMQRCLVIIKHCMSSKLAFSLELSEIKIV